MVFSIGPVLHHTLVTLAPVSINPPHSVSVSAESWVHGDSIKNWETAAVNAKAQSWVSKSYALAEEEIYLQIQGKDMPWAWPYVIQCYLIGFCHCWLFVLRYLLSGFCFLFQTLTTAVLS